MNTFTVSQKAKKWRVIHAYKDDFNSVEYEFTEKMTYRQAEDYFNLITAFSEYPNRGKLITCVIVAEHSGIELVCK